MTMILDLLKGSVREKWKGVKAYSENKRFWSLLILLLSVASIRRKWLKMTHTAQPCTVYFLWSKSYFWKHSFLFRGFLILKTTFSYFPGMFENPAPGKYYSKKQNQKYKLYTYASKNNRWLLAVISEWFVWN